MKKNFRIINLQRNIRDPILPIKIICSPPKSRETIPLTYVIAVAAPIITVHTHHVDRKNINDFI